LLLLYDRSRQERQGLQPIRLNYAGVSLEATGMADRNRVNLDSAAVAFCMLNLSEKTVNIVLNARWIIFHLALSHAAPILNSQGQ
jgi:hypothetical protein